MSVVRVYASVFRTAKAGNDPTECDDAHYPHGEREFCGTRWRCAVADGATETSYSGLWARLLARAFGHGKLDDLVAPGALDPARAIWSSSLARKSLPWFAAEKAERGAYATLLGLTIDAGKSRHSGTWTAVAVGDSCVAQVRNEGVILLFPLDASQQFNARPHLLATRVDADADTGEHIRRHAGEWQSGDSFYLMTDALSAWFIGEVEDGRRPWEALRDLGTSDAPGSFEDFVRDLRDSHHMKNDDVTLMHLVVE